MCKAITPQTATDILRAEYLKHGLAKQLDRLMVELEQSRAFLFLSRQKDGFVVVKPCQEKNLLWIEFAHCERPGAIKRYFGFLVEVAAMFECKKMGCWTWRKAFIRILPKLGFKQIQKVGFGNAIEWEF